MSEEKNKSIKDHVESVKTKGSEFYNTPIVIQTHTLGLISFIMAIIGIFTSFLFPFAIQIIGIILGHVASSEIKANPGKYTGSGLVTAGLIINYAFLIFPLIGLFLIVIGLGSLYN
tara:strand:+ start:858 stop:1205 length:348 start_codon:yes stop_codon:yes gene_type:complete